MLQVVKCQTQRSKNQSQNSQMTKLYYRLNLPVDTAINPSFNKENLYSTSEFCNSPIGIWNFKGQDIFKVLNKSWVKSELEPLSELLAVMVFYRAPNYQEDFAHLDMRRYGDVLSSAINWVISENDDSNMVWYCKPLSSLPTSGITDAGTSYCYWPKSILGSAVDQVTIGKHPTLVCTNLPHSVQMGKSPRWVLSSRFNEFAPTWDDAIKFYSKWIC